MAVSARDVAYGRQGGRIVKFEQAVDDAPCEVCGSLMTCGQKGRHAECSPSCRHGVPVDRCRGWKGACDA